MRVGIYDVITMQNLMKIWVWA